MSDRPQDPWAPDGDGGIPSPPPPPPPGPVTLEEAATVDSVEVRTGGVGARIVAIAVGAVLLLAGGAFAATQLGGQGAAGSPEAAVDELFQAIGDEDVLGVLAALEPGERDTLREPTEQLFEELVRLEVVDDSFELTAVPGVDFGFEGMTYRTEPIIDGLARVYITGGTARYAVDGAELPVGDFLADTLDRFGVDPSTFEDEDTEDAMSTDDDFLVARETDDGWRVSIGYTAAEAARLGAGKPVPATGMAPLGAESPEAAVEGFLQAATAMDVRGLVARLSPDEFRALHHYWPVLVDDSSLPSPDDLGVAVSLRDLELDSQTDGDRAQVFIRSIGVDVDGEGFSGGGTIADGCLSLRGDALEAAGEELQLDDDRICMDELDELFEQATGDLGLGRLEPMVPSGEQPSIGITTTRVDGKWFVAPIRTYADIGIAMLATIDREDLDAAVEAIESFFGEGFFSGGAIGGGFLPPGLGGMEELDGFDDLGGIEEEAFSEIGEPIDPLGATADARTTALVEELVAMVAGDTEVAACVIAELQATATAEQMVELADAYEYDLEPSPPVQELFFGALQRCGG